MPTCSIDGKSVEFQVGENLVDIAKRAGINIPVFCYHPGLSVVAQCRMCSVDVEKMPKIQTACSTKATEGMVVQTNTPRVKDARESVMEFLLINHPLDCPICDKSGECDLQDHSYDHGSADMRTTEDRRTYLDLDMGPVIRKNMNRCIHCTRCIRFGDEVAHMREMVALQRGNNTEITTIDGRALETDYAGNYADICPTGSLTLRDFRFNKRVWFLKKTPSICEGCSKGCNLEIHHDANVVQRCIPRENMKINRHWLCDEGRFNFRHTQDPERIVQLESWSAEVFKLKETLSREKWAVLLGTDLTIEEMSVIVQFSKSELSAAPVFHFGTPGVFNTSDDGAEDALLRRKSKTANLNGAVKLGIEAYRDLPNGVTAVMIFSGGRAVLPSSINKAPVKKVGVGVFRKDESSGFTSVLPGLAFTEKAGTVLNYENTEQKFQQAVKGPRGCKPIAEILMMWTHLKKSETSVA